jgi:Protein of unknown function (DUF4235)
MLKMLLKAELPVLVVAGILGQKVAAKLWEAVSTGPVPDTAQKDVRWELLLPVAVVEGTFYKLARMALDRGLREAVSRREGRWIGKAGEGE